MSFPNLSALTPDAMAADRRVQVAYARAWEAVVETHRMEAASFVEALAPLVSVDEALDAYFREVPVPLGMRDAVRTGAFLKLDFSTLDSPAPAGTPGGWALLNPGTFLGVTRRMATATQEARRRMTLATARALEGHRRDAQAERARPGRRPRRVVGGRRPALHPHHGPALAPGADGLPAGARGHGRGRARRAAGGDRRPGGAADADPDSIPEGVGPGELALAAGQGGSGAAGRLVLPHHDNRTHPSGAERIDAVCAGGPPALSALRWPAGVSSLAQDVAHCPTCGLRFDRGEPGYYLGAIWINLLLAESLSMAVIFTVIVRAWPTPPWDTLAWTAPLEALIAPFILFPFSKTLFLAFDMGIRPLAPKDFCVAVRRPPLHMVERGSGGEVRRGPRCPAVYAHGLGCPCLSTLPIASA